MLLHPLTDNLCNCDANDDSRWLEDHGYLDEKNRLPVTQMRFGDTGSYNEEGYATLGPLQCYSSECDQNHQTLVVFNTFLQE